MFMLKFVANVIIALRKATSRSVRVHLVYMIIAIDSSTLRLLWITSYSKGCLRVHIVPCIEL